MPLVTLAGPSDVQGFLAAARSLAGRGAPPEQVLWRIAGARDQHDLFADAASASFAQGPPSPPAYDALMERALLHSDPDRHALAYRILYRLRTERKLLAIPTDVDIARVTELRRSVRRDMHKMTAFVRFRAIRADDGGEVFVAWFEPDHHIVAATAPFFARRFSNMRWSILTPRASAHWDGESLAFGPGAQKRNAPGGDALEDVWRAYYAAIFNPARLNLKAMTREMPRKYWRNLPEADLIEPLTRAAAARSKTMIEAAPTLSRRSAPAAPIKTTIDPESCESLAHLADALRGCENCDLYKSATQPVAGEGAAHAPIMFVGEQPGDEEDLSGKPFVGPAGRLLNTALERVGIDRTQAYVTNAVKHFKFEPRGKKRIHKKPGAREIAACQGWLDREIEIVRPRLIVALGATAAGALVGRATPLRDLRGRTIPLASGIDMWATVHPSYLLRLIDPEQKKVEWRAFLADLADAKRLAAT